MEQFVATRQMVGLCWRCGGMAYLKDDYLSYCNGCGERVVDCQCEDRDEAFGPALRVPRRARNDESA
jgi:hypothetical protein